MIERKNIKIIIAISSILLLTTIVSTQTANASWANQTLVGELELFWYNPSTWIGEVQVGGPLGRRTLHGIVPGVWMNVFLPLEDEEVKLTYFGRHNTPPWIFDSLVPYNGPNNAQNPLYALP